MQPFLLPGKLLMDEAGFFSILRECVVRYSGVASCCSMPGPRICGGWYYALTNLGESGGMIPQENFEFWISEITSDGI